MELKATKRDGAVKPGRLRRGGRLPAVVYGHRVRPVSIDLDTHELERVLVRAGHTHLIDLVVESGRPHKVLVKEVQRSPRHHGLLHVDFQQVSLREKLQVDVPVAISGAAEPVTLGDADVLVVLHTLKVESLPTDIPNAIEVDISGLAEVDAGVRIADLSLPPEVSVLGDPDELIVKLAARRVAAIEEAEAEAAEAEAAEAPEEEAAAAAEEGEATASEPSESSESSERA